MSPHSQPPASQSHQFNLLPPGLLPPSLLCLGYLRSGLLRISLFRHRFLNSSLSDIIGLATRIIDVLGIGLDKWYQKSAEQLKSNIIWVRPSAAKLYSNVESSQSYRWCRAIIVEFLKASFQVHGKSASDCHGGVGESNNVTLNIDLIDGGDTCNWRYLRIALTKRKTRLVSPISMLNFLIMNHGHQNDDTKAMLRTLRFLNHSQTTTEAIWEINTAPSTSQPPFGN